MRDTLYLSRPKFAALLGKAESTIEKLEAEPSQEFARQLAALAREHHLSELEAVFLSMAEGDSVKPDAPSFYFGAGASFSADVQAFLQICLELYNDRNSDSFAGDIVRLVWSARELRQRLRESVVTVDAVPTAS